MDLILVLNSGSTSLKYKLFDFPKLEVIEEGKFTELSPDGKEHHEALKQVLKEVGDLTEIKAVGHRIVHGGVDFREPVVLDEEILIKLSKYNHLAPLHNPCALSVVGATCRYLPNVLQLACFDTSFFANLPDKAKIYPIPLEYFERYQIQRFGFHGISHQYVMEQAAKDLRKKPSQINLITIHLGGGASMVAIEKGQPIDTTMGFTPMGGLPMMTRSGSIDPGIIFYLNKELGLTLIEIRQILNYQSGIQGLSGKREFLDLLRDVKKKNPRAQLAYDIFTYQIQKHLTSYWGILGGKVNAVVFTGGIGAGQAGTRNMICKGLGFLKKTKILAIPADEERAIAEEVKRKLEIEKEKEI